MEKFKGKYRIESARLIGYDYSKMGIYFVTICTDDRWPYFGEVVGGEMVLSIIGWIADLFWQEIPVHHPYVVLDEYVVMPNHIHGLIKIQNRNHNPNCRDVALPRLGEGNAGVFDKNRLIKRKRTYTGDYPRMSEMSPRAGSLPVVVGSFKSALTKYVRICGLGHTIWQERFYDHIVGNNKSLRAIREYIRNNPKKWEQDRNNPANLWM